MAPGGLVYHVLNRAAGRMKMFRHEADFAAFERVVQQAHERCPIRILSFCVLSNHWHFVVWPRQDGQVTEFFRWLAHTHAMRWRVSHRTVGYGSLYQGRFKSFPVQDDQHLLKLCRYVERNPLAAGVVGRAEQWRFGSLWLRLNGDAKQRSILSAWPLQRPRDWTRLVNQPLHEADVAAIRTSLERGRPLGSATWTQRTAQRLDLGHTLRPEGRPRKDSSGKN
jgi:putative transposase